MVEWVEGGVMKYYRYILWGLHTWHNVCPIGGTQEVQNLLRCQGKHFYMAYTEFREIINCLLLVLLN